MDTPQKSSLKRIIALVIIVLSCIFFVLSLAGVIGIWVYNQPLTERALTTIETTSADLDGAAAAIELSNTELISAQAQIDLLNSKIRDCSLLAPISGTVLAPEQPEKLLGYFVREGEPLCRIGSIADRVRVKIAVPPGWCQARNT